MQGQLEWDGSVLPIQEITWDNVLAAAARFRGLELNEDFFVTYTDDDGDVINVKNEVDLAEAIRWAQEQHVPCLCLKIPFASESESDSDADWAVVEENSPRLSSASVDMEVPPIQPLEVEDAQPIISLVAKGNLAEQASSEIEPEETPEAQPPRPFETPEEEPAVEAPGVEAVLQTPPEEPALEAPADEPALEASKEEPALEEPVAEVPVEEPASVVEDAAKTEPQEIEEEVDTVSFQEEVVEQEIAVEAHEEDQVPAEEGQFNERINEPENEADVQEEPGSAVDHEKVVNIFLSIDEQQGDTEGREALLQVLSDPRGVNALVELFRSPAMQRVVTNAAQHELAQPGTVLKSIQAQTFSAFLKNPALLDSLGRVPNYDQLLPKILGMLKPARKEKQPEPVRQLHENVRCDGCDSDPELSRSSLEAGFRNAHNEILGIRYKSAVLPDYDLCEACEADGRFQEHAGPFLKITDPRTAPDVILCALPGTTSSMMSQLDNLDWRNPVAREFLEFVQNRRQRAFPQQREAPASAIAPVVTVAAPAPETVPAAPAAENVAQAEIVVEEAHPVTAPQPPAPVPALQPRCQHLLRTFSTPHAQFTCDFCHQQQPPRSTMHGCRTCNFDICEACQAIRQLPLEPLAPVATPPQARFVSDVTLADGCVVRPGERLTKTWRVRNSGQEQWPAGTRIAHVGGDSFGGPVDGVQVPLAKAGEAVNISVPLVMPTQPGRYTSYWRMMSPPPANARFGHRFWVTVNVVPPANAPVPAPAAAQAPSAPPMFHLGGLGPNSTFGGHIIAPPAPGFLPGSPAPIARPPARAAPPPPPQVAVPPPVVRQDEPVIRAEYQEALVQVVDMGITADIDKIVRILEEVRGDTSAAVERLLQEN